MRDILLQCYTSTKLHQIKVYFLLLALSPLLFSNSEVYAMQKTKHIVLLGASVGKAWNIESLPQRLMQNGSSHPTPYASRLAVFPYRFEYVGVYQFDKSKALQQILQRKENKPEAILIKECAAYFPGYLPKYQELMKGWVTQCKQAGVIPIPTTVVPVVREEGFVKKVKQLVKKILGRATTSSRIIAILQYNDWIKLYSQKEGLIVLDLEAPLRISLQDRSLRLDLHTGDGLHLNEKAYSLLDQIVLPTLDDIFQKNRQKVSMKNTYGGEN
jgi:hypothetical protein